MQTVTATDLARNTRKIIDSVSHGETVVVERNHAQVARIVPAEVTMTARAWHPDKLLPGFTKVVANLATACAIHGHDFR